MAKFEHNDFPEDPDWGMKRRFLDVPNDASYRKNTEGVNYARAFAEAKKQGLPDDICLAVAACVREGGYGIQQGHNYPMDGMEVVVKPVEGVPAGMTVPPLIEVNVDYIDGNKRSFKTEDVLHYHIPTITGRELTQDGATQLPEALWQMATHPEAGKSKINVGRMHVSDGWMGSNATRVIGLYSRPMDEKRYTPVLYAKFPIDRLELTANERTLLNEAGDDGFELVMEQRVAGNKVEGKEREQLIAEVRAHRRAKTEAVERQQVDDRAAEEGQRIAEAALRPKGAAQPGGWVSRIGKALRGGNR